MQNGTQMRFTKEEIDLLKRTFKDNDDLLKVLRKVFLPEYDPKAPVTQVIDLWMTVPVKELTPEAAYVKMLARNDLISHVEFQLQQIKHFADLKEETQEEIEARAAKNSTK